MGKSKADTAGGATALGILGAMIGGPLGAIAGAALGGLIGGRNVASGALGLIEHAGQKIAESEDFEHIDAEKRVQAMEASASAAVLRDMLKEK